MLKVSENPTSATAKNQIDWAKKLEHIEFNDLKQVRAFSGGGYSLVSLVQLSDYPESSFALKSIQKAKITKPTSRQNLLTEKKILSEIQSDFIIKMYKTFKNNTHLHFLCEYLPGGDLIDLAPVSEGAAKFYVACVVEALDCLHGQDIVHNDLKPDNLVMDADGYVKLIDFGLARKVPRGEMLTTSSGTFCYLPPEVAGPMLADELDSIRRDRAADLWALGVVLYGLLTASMAFDNDDDVIDVSDRGICENVMAGIRSVPFPREHFSKEAKDFVCSLCVEDPSRRLGYNGIDEIRKHRWFKNFEWNELRNRTLKAPMVPAVDGVLDTHNFSTEFELDSDVKEDESDWDMEF